MWDVGIKKLGPRDTTRAKSPAFGLASVVLEQRDGGDRASELSLTRIIPEPEIERVAVAGYYDGLEPTVRDGLLRDN